MARFTLNDLRKARVAGRKTAVLTCYDYSMARLMDEANVPVLLVGDSAASVILGHPTTLPVSLDFMIEITAAVRRGAPNALVMGDMPFGSYQASDELGAANVFRMIQQSGCDMVKLEVSDGQIDLVKRLTDAGVAVVAHVGLRPQAIGLMGSYQSQGRTPAEADAIVALALRMATAGAAAILIEATPPEVAKAVITGCDVPVIGCGAGPDCHGSVIVTHDAIGLTSAIPKFVPKLGDLRLPMVAAFAEYVSRVSDGRYPAAEHFYAMKP